MVSTPPPTLLILSDLRVTIGHLTLDWEPQPGAYVEFADQPYVVLERRHRYALSADRYHLKEVALYVQKAPALLEKSLLNGRWVMGDVTCQYNAHSELIRCAINPEGPCDRCVSYQPIQG